MRTHLRNLLLLAVFGLTSLTAQAQFQFGGGVGLGLDFNEFGIQARGQYTVNETWRGAADFTYFLIGEEFGSSVSAYEFNVNAHYILLDQGDGALKAYALGGLNVARYSVDIPDIGFLGIDPSYTDVGVNLGGGVNLPLGPVLGYAELKYAAGGSQFGITAGVLFGG